jgi:hypothetical protein
LSTRKSGDGAQFPSIGAGGTERGTIVSTRFDETSMDARDHHDSIPDVRPWREVGWIFRDGAAQAIERQGDRTRARSARFSHLREE